MDLKFQKKISSLNFNENQVIPINKYSQLKGGGYFCCTRNKWIGKSAE